MEHEKAQTLLSDYLEGELEPDLVSELELHLSQCSECRSVLESLKQLMGVVRAIPPVRVPDNFASKVRRRARRAGLWGASNTPSTQRMTTPFVGMWTTWGLMLALGLVLVIVFIAQHQIDLLSSQGQFFASVHDEDELRVIASLARELNLEVSPTKGLEKGLIILVPKDRWTSLYQLMKDHGKDKLIPITPPAPDTKGIIHLLLYSSKGLSSKDV